MPGKCKKGKPGVLLIVGGSGSRTQHFERVERRDRALAASLLEEDRGGVAKITSQEEALDDQEPVRLTISQPVLLTHEITVKEPFALTYTFPDPFASA